MITRNMRRRQAEKAREERVRVSFPDVHGAPRLARGRGRGVYGERPMVAVGVGRAGGACGRALAAGPHRRSPTPSGESALRELRPLEGGSRARRPAFVTPETADWCLILVLSGPRSFHRGKTEASSGPRRSQNQNSWPPCLLKSAEFGWFLMCLQHNRSTWYSHSKQTPRKIPRTLWS